MTSDRPRALIVDDEPDICELLAITLDRMQVDADTCSTLDEARSHLAARDYNVCLTDMRLPDGDGLDLVDWIQSQEIGVPVAVITAHGNVETAVRALKLGAFDFISKPVDLADLRRLVGSALRLAGDSAPGSEESRGLLGRSPAMDRVRELIGKVARSQAPVHITGESGTGKELVARLIHAHGPRTEGPFVPVNCGAIPSELMESEFFGYRKGAFTGAVSDKDGLFATASGGTLFLDEIADLPLAMQVKLLRVIQEKAFRPVGQTEEVPADVRILSATHRDLGALVSQGQFREDLYYRVNVIELRVPPLRERGDDVLLLAAHYLDRLSRQLGFDSPPTLTEDATSKIASYRFPGNVRELENMLERAVALCDGESIDADDIHIQATVDEGPETTSTVLDDAVEHVQREAISRALEQHRFNKTATAKSLGVTLRQLRYRMQKLGLD